MSSGSRQNPAEAPPIGQFFPRPLLPKFPNQRHPAPHFSLGCLAGQIPDPCVWVPPSFSVLHCPGSIQCFHWGMAPPSPHDLIHPQPRGLCLEEYVGVGWGTEGLWGTLLPGALGRGWAARLGGCPRSGAPGRGEGGGRGLAVTERCWPWLWTWLAASSRSHTHPIPEDRRPPQASM